MHYLGIDVSKASHQCVILDAEGEALGKSFTVQSSKDDFANLVKKLSDLNIQNSDITAGLEATGNLWENIYIYLKEQGIKVTLLNPFQTNKFHQAMMKKAKTDSIDALVIAGLLRSGCAAGSSVSRSSRPVIGCSRSDRARVSSVGTQRRWSARAGG